MPATEQTWRNQKLMHVVFGVTTLAMLIATIWMLAKDHTREWKPLQKKQRKIEQFFVAGRISEEETAKHAEVVAKWETALAEARSETIDPVALEQFKLAVIKQAEKSGQELPNFEKLSKAVHPLHALSEEAMAARVASQQAHQEARRALEKAQAAEAENQENASELRGAATTALNQAKAAEVELKAADAATATQRDRALAELRKIAGVAKFNEDKLSQARKFRNADLTATLSLLDIAVGEDRGQAEVDRLQDKANHIRADVDKLSLEYDAAVEYRKKLEAILRDITEDEDEAKTELTAVNGELSRLHASLETTWNKIGRAILENPIIDAFDNSDLQVNQIWLPDLTINYNFSSVARFDRCITCHRVIDKTAPGSPIDPAYDHVNPSFEVALATPDEQPQPTLDKDGNPEPVTLRSMYGIVVAEEGVVDSGDIMVEAVVPERPGADAGLKMGDVIEQIDGVQMLTRHQAEVYLLHEVTWGQPVKLTIRRGLPHPFASHPRLDLFLGSLSPHKIGDMGCTICHDGQGSATAFKWASHTPDTPEEAERWRREHGWFDNHHWIFPMYPDRFVESSCLKCHHSVVELQPSARYPEPPAAKLMAGFDHLKTLGCFGCHEINGFDGPDRTIGPDLRTEPNFFAAAQAILEEEKHLDPQEREWAEQLVYHPEDNAARHRLYEAIANDKLLAKNPQAPRETSDEESPEEEATKPRFSAQTHKLGDLLKDIESPGQLRRVGPSLRFLASKVGFDFLYDWIRKPTDFRPSTKMPQFFGLHDHLKELTPAETQQTKGFEAIEIRAITEYLLGASKPFEYLEKPAGITEAPSAERGKHLFEMRGCLACHSHQEFPGIKADQGPDLTGLAAKFKHEKGTDWLYSWIRQPNRYHVRTKMPDLFLEPITDEQGKVSDPAADIVAYLLTGDAYQPKDVPNRQMTSEEEKSLHELALEYLAKTYPERRAEEFLQNGIPTDMASQVKGDDAALLGTTTNENRVAKQLEYVGRRAISKYGCTGCHDIPGFEDAKPIGTGLADWGRKDSSKLAFEQIVKYLATYGVDGHGVPHGHDVEHAQLSVDNFDQDTGFFISSLLHHGRQGFLWQKLREPRSYDYKKVENKSYNERLRMPQFNMTEKQREQIMTFVLGLVAEPPAERYIYNPGPRQEAIVKGLEVLDKYNCAGCHSLTMDRWEFNYHPDDFEDPAPLVDFPFLADHFSADQVAQSLKVDRRGLRHGVVHGRPVMDEETGKPKRLDEDGVPIEPDDTTTEPFYSFVLWEPAIINGKARPVGIQNLPIRDSGLTKYPGWGGTLADYLFPVAIAAEKVRNPQVNGSEAWGWLPPPLVGEGKKVQPEWLHSFLLDPTPIRPAAVLRMPKFNMSSEEATAIVNYFAAMDHADYPYPNTPRMHDSFIASLIKHHPDQMRDAMNIVVDNNYCVKCHVVGDFTPGGSRTALAPNLDAVYRRLRPEYVRRWVANPKRILPYTGMPVNIQFTETPPHFGGVAQDLFHGTSTEQLDGLVDFLLNYDRYTRQQVSVKSLIPAAAPAKSEPAEGEPAGPEEEETSETAATTDEGSQ